MAHDNQGVPRIHQHNTSHQRSKIMMSLPETYTNVPPISIPHNVIRSPTSESQAIPRTINIDEDEMQRCWLEHISIQLTLMITIRTLFLLYLGLLISLICKFLKLSKPPGIIALLPLFRDSEHCPAIWWSMEWTLLNKLHVLSTKAKYYSSQ